MILDTEFFISIEGGDTDAIEFATELEIRGVLTRVPTIVIQELYVSVGAGGTPTENVREYEAMIANKPIVPLNENIARRAGALEGKHLTSDTKPKTGIADAIVAATGLVYNEPVVTNDGDFEDVDDLEVELY